MTLLNSFVSACILNSILSVFLGVFVYLRGKNKIINKVWVICCLSVSLWIFGLGMMTNSSSEKMALFWLKYVHYLGAIFIPIVFLHICLVLLDLHQKKKKLILISYIIGGLLQIANFTGYLATVEPLSPFKYYTKAGIFYPAFTIIFFIYVFYALYELFKGYLQLFGYKKKQIIYFFAATLIGFLAGSTAFFPVFNLPLFPHGIYLFALYPIIISYAIIRHQLLGIDVIIKKGTLYFIMMTVTTGVYFGAILLFEFLLRYFIGYSSIIIQITIIITVVLIFLPIHNKIEVRVDKAFFREKIDYSKCMCDFSQGLVSVKVLKVNQLMEVILNGIFKIIKLDQITLIFYDIKTRAFQIKYIKKSDNLPKEIVPISNENSFIKWLGSYKKMAIKDRLIEENIDNTYSYAIKQMENLETEIAFPLNFNRKFVGVLFLGKKLSEEIYTGEELKLLKDISLLCAVILSNSIAAGELKRVFFETVAAFVTAIDVNDPYTKKHSYRVAKIAVKIAKEMEIPHKKIETLKYACILHDIGKIGVDTDILIKSGPLTKKEYKQMKNHPKVGHKILYSLDFFKEISDIILNHHERWDGKGYPNKIKQEEIPLLSRILFVADAYDCMTFDQSYRLAGDKNKAIEEIKRCAYTQFDPTVVQYFLLACHEKKI